VDEVRRIVGPTLTEEEARALVEWHTALARNVAAFPAADLRGVEPPLRSTPGPEQP
jgi:hypothetical protein